MEKYKQSTFWTLESWNHNAFEDKNYHMIWGPFPIQTVTKDKDGKVRVIDEFRMETISSNLRKFDPNVRFVKYRHAENNHPRESLAA